MVTGAQVAPSLEVRTTVCPPPSGYPVATNRPPETVRPRLDTPSSPFTSSGSHESAVRSNTWCCVPSASMPDTPSSDHGTSSTTVGSATVPDGSVITSGGTSPSTKVGGVVGGGTGSTAVVVVGAPVGSTGVVVSGMAAGSTGVVPVTGGTSPVAPSGGPSPWAMASSMRAAMSASGTAAAISTNANPSACGTAW